MFKAHVELPVCKEQTVAQVFSVFQRNGLQASFVGLLNIICFAFHVFTPDQDNMCRKLL